MNQRIIPPTEAILVRTTLYVSPIYVAEFDGIILGGDIDRPDTIRYKEVLEDNINEWLAHNSLARSEAPFLGQNHSDFGYFFVEKQGAHVVSPEKVNLVRTRGGQDLSYEQRLTIRSAPSGIALPSGLVAALAARDYERVEEFKDRRF